MPTRPRPRYFSYLLEYTAHRSGPASEPDVHGSSTHKNNKSDEAHRHIYICTHACSEKSHKLCFTSSSPPNSFQQTAHLFAARKKGLHKAVYSGIRFVGHTDFQPV